jgi:hypothetical protein
MSFKGEVRRFLEKSVRSTSCESLVKMPPRWQLGSKLPTAHTALFSTFFYYMYTAVGNGAKYKHGCYCQWRRELFKHRLQFFSVGKSAMMLRAIGKCAGDVSPQKDFLLLAASGELVYSRTLFPFDRTMRHTVHIKNRKQQHTSTHHLIFPFQYSHGAMNSLQLPTNVRGWREFF